MVELIWTFDYIKIGKEFEVASSRQYINGNYVGEVDAQEKIMLVSYLALFPKKDILQIKLGTSQTSLYNILYFDKRFKDQNFIGVFSFAEYNTSQPFIWGKEEEIMKEIFKQFQTVFPKLFDADGTYELDTLNAYYRWMDHRIRQYYEKWQAAKIEYYGNKGVELQHNLADTFSSITQSIPIMEIKNPKRNKNIIKISAKDINSQSNGNSKEIDTLSEFDNQYDSEDINHLLGNMLKLEKTGKLDVEKYSYDWEVQLMNSYGNPLTRIVRFHNGKLVEHIDQDEFMSQGLEAMSYSVLKSIVEQKNFDLRYIKSATENGGIEYIFFQSVDFDTNKLLVIMRSVITELKNGIAVDLLLGGERLTLQRIAFEIYTDYRKWFALNEYNRDVKNGPEEISNIFYRNCRKYFKEI